MFGYFLENMREKYELIELLKSGSRSTVRLMRHKSTGKRFVFREFLGSGSVYKKLMLHTTEHLPEVYEFAEENGHCLVLEEYIQGDNLGWLLEGSLLTPDEARDCFRQICLGALCLHSLGAVHRDIKPDNVIIRGDTAVLVDFDASRLQNPETSSDTVILGTTGYAAPEQFGFSQTDQRADIYSLGVVLNVMLTGQHPSVVLAPGRLGKVVEKCTMTSPARRYRDVFELQAAL